MRVAEGLMKACFVLDGTSGCVGVFFCFLYEASLDGDESITHRFTMFFHSLVEFSGIPETRRSLSGEHMQQR